MEDELTNEEHLQVENKYVKYITSCEKYVFCFKNIFYFKKYININSGGYPSMQVLPHVTLLVSTISPNADFYIL